tara:strand:- start:2359 stop:2805 length:447 start_codon:yes stop_codon:yes gene_type:complete
MLSLSTVPHAAKWLGALGAIPFIVLAFATVISGSTHGISQALIAYGAVILSFLGGIQWGLAIAPSESGEADANLFRRLGWSVVPSLIAWGAMLLQVRAGLLVLAVAFVIVLLLDLQACRRGEAPPWYPNLRLPLTAAVVSSLTLSVIG